ncbi:MAG TPA: metallophosphoesterase [Candidatus Choladousia intestinavium]|uniref:Phosphoesterase n=1 Tax=Candidatus Choladousia intestinavium TaxID=2840727 RepID=A0A9D1A9R0_9FIRM|nr:metallophosphoesterase [Candidatus Choladousia intestinavium]
MRILVVSDTHGREENLELILSQMPMPDHVIHLGDSEGGEDYIREIITCPLHIVAGNCDFFSHLPKVDIVEIGGYRIMLTHGHYYYVSVGTRDLVEDAKANGCNVVMFGHTHRPFINQDDPELTILNPGSLSFPRQEGRRPSFIMMEIGEDGIARYKIHYL